MTKRRHAKLLWTRPKRQRQVLRILQRGANRCYQTGDIYMMNYYQNRADLIREVLSA